MTIAPVFAGVRVLDFSRVLAGPYCTAMLADVGAEVIKVEPPQGDDQRHMGVVRDGESANFALLNRNKKSIRLDLTKPDAQALARQLAARSDVVVENFKPGVAARLGIGYELLAEENPRLVYCSISGFGQNGPNAARPAYDVVAQALSGIMNITGEPDGPPTLIGESIGDISAGMFAAWGIASALFARERSGAGRRLDIAMFDSLFSMQPTALAQVLYAGVEPMRVGNRHPLSSPFGAFAALDGHFVMAAANDKLFRAVAEVIGEPGLAADPRFSRDYERSRHDAELRQRIEAWSGARTLAFVLEALEAAGVPAAPIQGTGAAAQSEQALARGLLSRIEHPYWGPSRVATQPVRFVPQSAAEPQAAPALGQHTDSVLREVLGFGEAEIAPLRAAGLL